MYRPLSPGVFPKATLSLISGRMFTWMITPSGGPATLSLEIETYQKKMD